MRTRRLKSVKLGETGVGLFSSIRAGMEQQLLLHRRLVALQYFAHVPPRVPSFHWPDSGVLVNIQEDLYRDLSLEVDEAEEEDDGLYKRAFLKELIRRLEKELDGVDDAVRLLFVPSENLSRQCLTSSPLRKEISGDLLQAYVASMNQDNAAKVPKNRRMVYYYPEHPPVDQKEAIEPIFEGWNKVVLSEDGSMIAKGTTGLKTWEASLRLAAHLLVHREIVFGQNARVLELGSGSGLLGTIVARGSGPDSQIMLTDVDGIVLEQLQKTVSRNLPASSKVSVSALDWLSVADDSSIFADMIASLEPQVVLGADIVYDPGLMEPLCQVLKTALSPPGRAERHPFALIASTVRNEETFAIFRKTLERNALRVRIEALTRPRLDLQRGVITLTSGQGELDLFPTPHDPSRDGDICLLHITAG